MSSVVSASISGVRSLLLLQVWSRITTFVLNQLSLRYITRDVLGIVWIDMELVLSTILFLSREFIRMALLRSRSAGDFKALEKPTLDKKIYMDLQKSVNMSYIPAALGFLLSIAIIVYYSVFSTMPAAFKLEAVSMYALAAMIELASEPFYIMAQIHMNFQLRVAVEGSAVFAKCFSALGFLALCTRGEMGRVSERDGVLAFAASQIFYSVCMLLGYLISFRSQLKGQNVVDETGKTIKSVVLFVPRKVDGASGVYSFVDVKAASLAWTFAKQGFLKHFLTEGDKILSFMMTTAMRGDYALVERYGGLSSLIARILFQPIEEASRVYFVKSLGASQELTSAGVISTATAIHTMLRGQIYLGLIFVCIGTNYATLAIQVLAGKELSKGSSSLVMAAYCFYIPIMALNGVTEAFVQALGTEKTLLRQSYWMIFCWISFAGIGFTLVEVLQLGAVGIVLANCVNLCLRIGFSYAFIQEFFADVVPKRLKDTKVDDANVRVDLDKQLSLHRLVPFNVVTIIVFPCAWLLTKASSQYFIGDGLMPIVKHLSVGGGVGILALCGM
ncbi:Oligosaccharide translocation protein rft1 [Blyttiomyces sp. JEL0837]|nr:Oligosaccharide translocation protein rft1 [Blyttiomyces sp. JEL0837]